MEFGTISDWFMVIITTVTAYYLYKTLQSQKEVQQMQNRLFEIESIRFRESIKPVLVYKFSDIKHTPTEEGKEILSIEIANESNQMALELSPDYSESSYARPILIPMDFSYMKRHLEKGGKPYLIHFLITQNVLNYIVFSITYQDVAGTKYKQGVLCIKDKHGSEINPFLPEIIN